ncbi:MAG TPA: aminoglycoside phosphotransferase family protein, partial [Thermomicrobiales bacterium]|nr:aminoglycoside phosphotransferase family protein [Thermomicrobiales bacterium]
MDESNDAMALATVIAVAAGYHSRVAHARFLTGGISARIVAFDLVDGTGPLVTRLYGVNDVVSNPDIAHLEFDVLHHVSACGIPVARPIMVIDPGVLGPRPGLVTTLIDGDPGQRPADDMAVAGILANALRAIHGVHVSPKLRSQLPVAMFQPERWSTRWREIGISPQLMERLTLFSRQGHATRDVLLHGDFWPGNVLWANGSLSGIVDWEDVHFGDYRFDVAGGFLELVLATTLEAGQAFLA